MCAWGCNVDDAMERLCDDMDFYEECLELFAKDENFELMTTSLGKKDYEAMFNQSHTLKSVAGNLGLTPIFDIVSDVVEYLRHQEYDDLELKCAKISEGRNKLIQILNKHD